jgi:glycosyltransferase involved in cell wall biosynthesis
MWTLNGEKFLPFVFRRVEDVIPKEVVHKKILVDDHSTDKTAKIASDFNWQVYLNPSHGISSGANEALKHVDCDYFMSLEQDVLLSKNWIDKIPYHMKGKDVAVAQGVRFATEPTLRSLDSYSCEKNIKSVPQEAVFGKYGYSLDNNILNTKIIREVGGFPSDCPVCTDGILLENLHKRGYKWLIDKEVVSTHLRPGLEHHYDHQYTIINRCALSNKCQAKDNMKIMLRKFITSPVRSLIIAVETKNPLVMIVYPRTRFLRVVAFKNRKIRGHL